MASDMRDGEPTEGVVCVRCGKTIPVRDAGKLAEDFAVSCPACGQRAFYRIKDIKTIGAGRRP